MCSLSKPISVLAINNVKDPLVPWNGGDVTGPFGVKKLGKVLSVRQTIEYWVKHNGCAPSPTITQEPHKDPTDGTRLAGKNTAEEEKGQKLFFMRSKVEDILGREVINTYPPASSAKQARTSCERGDMEFF